jgi:SAM-dependent methyltransferase
MAPSPSATFDFISAVSALDHFTVPGVNANSRSLSVKLFSCCRGIGMSERSSAKSQASISRRPWNFNIQYHYLVLRSVPVGCQCALDVGCGSGLVTRKLVTHSESVIGIDVDPQALSLACAYRDLASHPEESRVHYVEGDVLMAPFPPASFDFISAVAALHHLPLRPALMRFRDLLRPGGTVAVIGHYRSHTLMDRACNAAVWPIDRILRVTRGCYRPPMRRQPPEETLAAIRGACREVLPGAVVKRLLLYRYFLIWRKT